MKNMLMLKWKNEWTKFLILDYFTAIGYHVESQYTESRWNHWEEYSTTFTVINKGRLHHHMVLMYFERMELEECFENCVRHLRCFSVNYNNDLKICEICDFDQFEAYTQAIGWQNFARDTKRVDGGFTPWFKVGECTKKCGGGVQRFYRSCENPAPRNGGETCYGEYTKEERCNEHPCPVNGNWGDWRNVGGCFYASYYKYHFQSKRRYCDSPEPLYGGLKCKDSDGKQASTEQKFFGCNPLTDKPPIHSIGQGNTL